MSIDLAVVLVLWVVPVVVGSIAVWPRASESYRRTLE